MIATPKVNLVFISLSLILSARSTIAQEYAPSSQDQIAPTSNQNDSSKNTEDLGGVVVDLTATKFGREFYEHFVSLWQDNPLSERYAIAVRERATARYGSQIFVEYAQRKVFQAFLPPSINAIRSASENAVSLVLENVVAADVQRLLIKDEDLGVDEI